VSGALPASLQATSHDDLARQLENLNIQVASRLADRTNEQREWFILRAGLFACMDVIPEGEIWIKKTESPDFIVFSNGFTIGIEVTELRGRSDGKAQNVADRESIDFRFVGEQTLTAKSVKKAQLIEEMEHGGRGFINDEPEKIAAGVLLDRIRAKEKRLQSENWKRSDREWLFVYNNFGFAGLNVKHVVKIVRDCQCESVFDKIILISSGRTIELAKAEPS